jgi:hypothetical protein
MVEIVLALGVIGVGVISVVGLFPLGINANKDAMTEDYASQVAEQFIEWIRFGVRTGDWDQWITDGNAFIPDSAPDPDAFDYGGDFLTDLFSDAQAIDGTNETLWDHDSERGLYAAVRYLDKTNPGTFDPPENGGEDILDFAAVLMVWRERVSIPEPGGSDYDVPYEYAAALNVEVSWPAQLPAERRTKRLYRYEIFNRD